MKYLNIIEYVFTVVGLGLLTGAYFFFLNTKDFLNNATSANGRVVELIRSESSDSKQPRLFFDIAKV